ncbi:MAG: riboflavin biosynthesis protein RibF [Candidatus Omnitrophota bacterium]
MKVIYGISNIKHYRRPVVALGVFDGMHRGHRRILKEAAAKARRIKGRSVVLTFWPHPQKEASLYSLKHRLKLIQELGIDICIVVHFDASFSRISPEVFVREVLEKKLGAAYVYVGRNFRFGRRGLGNPHLLERLSRESRFALRLFDIMRVNGAPISSSRIRRLIVNGSLVSAERLLLKPVTVLGTVVRGDSFASTKLGFPTANINPHHEILPPAGIYAVRVIIGREVFQGACYIGARPTIGKKVQKGRDRNIEVHIIDFNRNIYGREIEVQFLRKLRNEKKFSTPRDLARQIKIDILQARSVFPSTKTTTTSRN